MLKIKAPLPLVCRTSVLRLTDNFCQRVTGNYQILTASLNAEELLHLVTAPPEVYLAEGGMTTLVDASSTQVKQDIRLDMINNVLNRILVSDTYRMTYQDQVFVNSILRRMGVENVQGFLHQVSVLRKESRSRRELTQIYWSHLEQLQEWRELLLGQRQKEKEAEAETEKMEKEPFWLHQAIFNRLKTGAVYQEIQNFVSSFHGGASWIQDTEVQVAQQWVTAQNILLNRLKNAAGAEPVPLEYHHVNVFELGDGENAGAAGEDLKAGLVQAVLLNALDQMYTLRLEQLLNGKELWYQLAGAVYQSVSNTLERWEAYHISRSSQLIHQPERYMETVNRYQNREIEMLYRLLDRSSQAFRERLVSEHKDSREQLLEKAGPAEMIYGEERRLAEELSRENLRETERRREETRETHREEGQLWRELERIRRIEHTADMAMPAVQAQASLPGELHYRKDHEERESHEERLQIQESRVEAVSREITRLRDRQQKPEIDKLREETKETYREEGELWRELERINQRNLMNQEKVRLLENRLPAPSPSSIDRERARRDGLRAIENPQDVLLEYLSMETQTDRQQRVKEELRDQLFSRETRRILETLEQLRRTPQASDPETLTMQAQASLMRDIHYRKDYEERESHEERLQVQESHAETVSRQVTRLRDRQQKSEETVQELLQPGSPVELIHKRTENGLDEETLEELNMRLHHMQESRQTVEERSVREEKAERQSVQEIRRLQVERTEEIAELVRRNLQQQIGFLSDQIYGRMEKRLDGERRRRGL